jgi:SAM-dependent methyltransferase
VNVSRPGPGVADTVKRNAHVHRATRRMRRSVGRLVPPRRVRGIPGRVHFNDFMFTTLTGADAESYRERALNVIANLEQTLAAAGKTFDDIQRWLDFGCGYGRVIRFLVERVPAQRAFACDVVREGVDFAAPSSAFIRSTRPANSPRYGSALSTSSTPSRSLRT